MKVKFSLILLLFLSSVCFSQTLNTESGETCPLLNLISFVPLDYNYKLPITYELDLAGSRQSEHLKFLWTVGKSGRLVSGQGTDKIKVKVKSKDQYRKLVVTVKVDALPPICPNTAVSEGGK